MSEETSRRYRDRTVFGPFAEAHPEEVRAVEDEIGRPLPPDYLAFLRVANGGLLNYAVRIPPGADGDILVFSTLYRLGRNAKGVYGRATLLGAYRSLPGTVFAEAFSAQGIAADSLLPIACDGGDNQLFLDLSPGGGGRILAFVFGLPAWTGTPRATGCGVLADGFHDYLDTLFIDEESAEWTWEYYVGDAAPEDPWRQAVEEWLDQGLPGWRTRPWAPR
ncbi:hypothetical protein F4561_000490 [Lipingzhangella halophila]|uniref:Knr4/Smi1-like domain-containing protein n=1 Tax=Lipingzhangella halophila TaxID=1783352 RepID=A0A7W7W1G7_9ACTN|nr:SMI1/KNR4 family protein [Lipingzhangella halophila]MBB4929670.1 hypothetical protein [Lipingzhangella halophila]